MKNLITFGIIAIILISCEEVSKKTIHNEVLPLHLEELNYWCYTPVTEKLITDKFSYNTKISLYIKDKKGALYFKIYDNKNQLINRRSIL